MEARGIMFRRLALVGLSVAMVGCGGQLEKAQQATPPEDEYGKGLYTGYVDLSSREYNEGDYRDSDFFANRAIAVSEKTSFEAQFVDARDIPGETIQDMADARRQLVTALYFGAADKLPAEAAEAQVSFDCWLQEQEENRQPDDIAACKERFGEAIAALQAVSRTTAATPVLPDRLIFEVYFTFDSDELNESAQLVLKDIADIAKTYKEPVIAVIGNADTVGTTDYNVDLSQRRADAVAAALSDLGYEPEGVFAHGKEVLKVPTPDQVKEGLNRRAVIILRSGQST